MCLRLSSSLLLDPAKLPLLGMTELVAEALQLLFGECNSGGVRLLRGVVVLGRLLHRGHMRRVSTGIGAAAAALSGRDLLDHTSTGYPKTSRSLPASRPATWTRRLRYASVVSSRDIHASRPRETQLTHSPGATIYHHHRFRDSNSNGRPHSPLLGRRGLVDRLQHRLDLLSDLLQHRGRRRLPCLAHE